MKLLCVGSSKSDMKNYKQEQCDSNHNAQKKYLAGTNICRILFLQPTRQRVCGGSLAWVFREWGECHWLGHKIWYSMMSSKYLVPHRGTYQSLTQTHQNQRTTVLPPKLNQCLICSILRLALSTARTVCGRYSITSLLNHTYVKRSITILEGYLFNLGLMHGSIKIWNEKPKTLTFLEKIDPRQKRSRSCLQDKV